MTRSTLESIQTIKEIQANNGEFGANPLYYKQQRQCIECYGNLCFRLSNWENPTVDIIPLFESVDDLKCT
jgi:phosphoenolpyruvate carboxylase